MKTHIPVKIVSPGARDGVPLFTTIETETGVHMPNQSSTNAQMQSEMPAQRFYVIERKMTHDGTWRLIKGEIAYTAIEAAMAAARSYHADGLIVRVRYQAPGAVSYTYLK